jgi:endonuclease/exonuclease/phosphatase family metal-dependent hydrolase
VRFRVLTYNIHRAIGLDRRFRPDRIAEILVEHDADVVLLQEVDQGVPRSREMDLARELAAMAGYPESAVGHNVTLRKGRYGNATLSRHSIVRERNIDLTVGTRKRRGCQHTEILVAGATGRRHRVEIFNLHLGLSARERARQIELLVSSAEFTRPLHDVACLVAGDFNDWRSLLRQTFARRSFRCASDRRAGGRAIRTFPALFPQGALDRIYYRGPLRLLWARRCRMQLSRIASDHLPITAEFELHD